jgi:excisionase family DNA binding protein
MRNKLFYTTTEAGLLLGLSPKSITKYIELGQITAEKMGRDYLISLEEFERFKNTPRKVGRPSRATATIPANFRDNEDA